LEIPTFLNGTNEAFENHDQHIELQEIKTFQKKLLTMFDFSKLSSEHLANSNDVECKRFR
jgi:hypothetical protein